MEAQREREARKQVANPAPGASQPNPWLYSALTSCEEVDRWYEAALAAGGRDNGAPGERPYHPGYYAAYVLDPDGNNIEAVFHGDRP